MKIEIVNGEERIILDPKIDTCPLCETPLTKIRWSWRQFHGSASSDCCGMVCQIKSYYVDPKKDLEGHAFAKSLDEYDRIEFDVQKKFIEPLNKAIKELGIKDINNEQVYKKALECSLT